MSGESRMIRTVYFTAVPLFPSNNGGALVCRAYIRELACDPAVDLLACSTGPPEHEDANRQAVERLDADYVFLPFRDGRPSAARRIARRWPFLLEAEAIAHPNVDAAFESQLRSAGAQAVVVDYVPSASYVRSAYSAPVRRVTITLNREAAFYRELRRSGRLPPDASPSWIATARVGRFERWVYRKSDAVVALNGGDLPAWRGRPRLREVIPPAFEPNPARWRYTGRRTLFFVGNTAHYPNLHAIEWLATRLAPELEAVDGGRSVELRILGAALESVPLTWRRSNIVYLGTGDDATLAAEFVSAGLFVAPIANAYGSKIKLLDCVAHATPFVATVEALTGLPFLSAVPLINLEEPRAAAELIVGLLSRPATLTDTSDRLSRELDAFLEQRAGGWGRLLSAVVGKPR